MNWKIVGVSAGLISLLVVVLLVFAFPNVLVKAQHATMTLRVTDSETGRHVDDAHVYVDDKYAGTTAQGGELDVHQLEYGRHRVSVLVPYYEHSKVDKYVDVNGNVTVPVLIDMPNPTFQASLEVGARLDWLGFNEYGSVKVTLTNVGEVVSQDTVVLVLVYVGDGISRPVASRILSFGNIAPGALPIQREEPSIDEFVWLKPEHVAAVVIDRWKYTPQNEQVVAEASVPLGLAERVILDAYAYIQQHPETIGTIVKILLK